MTHLKNLKKINYFIVIAFIAQPTLTILSVLLFPADLTNDYPIYDPNSIMLMVCGGALGIAGMTVMGIKLADEKKVLPASGFTMLAISSGILLTSMFEISHVVSHETYEKFYRIQTSGNFLLLPGIYLISGYTDFKKWIRIIGLVSPLILVTASFLFLFGNRNFTLLEAISNIGFIMMFITFYSWAYNVHINYKQNQGKE